jgi:hypothetical protein
MTALKQRIMVQIADPEWTQEALYDACILARKHCGEVALVKMLAVQHLSWLGTSEGLMGLSELDRAAMKNYEATVEDYGVNFSSHVFQYFSLPEAVVEAAEYLDADIVFATLPKSLVPQWHEFQMRKLRHRLARRQRVLVEHKSLVAERPTTKTLPARILASLLHPHP